MTRGYRKIELGERSGKLTIIAKGKRDGGVTYYVVMCDCGGQFATGISNFRRGQACLKCGHVTTGDKKRIKQKGQERLYRIFRNMLGRCNDPKDSGYRWYGAKGIKVEWPNYTAFQSWAFFSGYEPTLTIERIDPTKNYSPTNCEWISHSENSRRARDIWRKETHFPIEMLWGAA